MSGSPRALQQERYLWSAEFIKRL